MRPANVALAILAAGAASRFGARKLEMPLGAEMLGCVTAARLTAFGFGAQLVVADPADERLVRRFAALGYSHVAGGPAADGLSRSVALAAQAALTTPADGLLICLADMPNVSLTHVAALLDAGTLAASSCAGVAMPPALFPRAAWDALAQLSGDDGAKALLAGATLIEADAWTLADVDTPDDLERISRSYRPSTARHPSP